jgi:glycosyltransferase involved in cell wall biosynthesis
MKICIILPAYNEAQTIAECILAFNASLPMGEIIVVNNDSSDNTEDLAKNVLLDKNINGQIINEYRRGKGNAVRRAFLDIDADIYVLVDADMTYPAKRVTDLIQPIFDNQADMVVGDRLTGGHYEAENKRKFHQFGNYLVITLINKLFGANLKDIMTGYRAFSRDFVKSYPILVEGFELETDVSLHALDKRFRILEIPIEYIDRPSGSQSKLNTISDGVKVISTILRILRHYRPLMFFGSISIGFFLMGILSAFPVISDWLLYKYIYHIPLAILSVGLVLSSFLALGIGLLLDSIVYQNKMNYERDFLSKNR